MFTCFKKNISAKVAETVYIYESGAFRLKGPPRAARGAEKGAAGPPEAAPRRAEALRGALLRFRVVVGRVGRAWVVGRLVVGGRVFAITAEKPIPRLTVARR